MRKNIATIGLTLFVLFMIANANASPNALNLTLAGQDVYGLSNFEIDRDSTQLPQPDQIASGALVVDTEAQMVTLHIERNFYCAPNSICTQQMPEPMILKLPITYLGTGFCGGQVISAELDRRAADGTYIGIHFSNDENNTCTKPKADDRGLSKPVKIQFTEQAARAPQPTTSTFEGVLGILN